jgi:hypothetical protein
MKRATLSLIMIMSLASQAALAQGTSTTTSKKAAPATYNYDPDAIPDTRPSPYLVDGFNVGFEYVSQNSSVADIKNKVTGNVEKGFKNDISQVPNQMGVKAGYKQITRGGLGFDLGISILKAEKRVENTSDLTTFMPSANLVIAAPQYVYGSLGLNTAIVAGDDNAKHDPHIGYQVGGGVILKKSFNLEIFYTWMNQRIEYQQALAEERVTSTNARLIYAF